MQWTSIAGVFGLGGFGLLLFYAGRWYFDRSGGTAKSVAAAAIVVGFAFMILSLAAIWVIRIRHLLHW